VDLSDFQLQASSIPESSYRPMYTMLWFLLHGDTVGNDEATATVDQAADFENSGVLSSGKLALTGTTVNIWAVGGVFASPAGDVSANSTEQALRDLFDLSTITKGGILIMFNMSISAAPIGTEELILDASSTANSGGWEIDVNATNGYIFVKMKPSGGSIATVARSTDNTPLNTTQSYVIYLDITNNCAVIMRDKIQQTSVAELPALPIVDATKGVSLFSRTDGIKAINSGGSGCQLSNMQIYRVTDDIAGLIPTISIQYSSNPNNIPKILRSQ